MPSAILDAQSLKCPSSLPSLAQFLSPETADNLALTCRVLKRRKPTIEVVSINGSMMTEGMRITTMDSIDYLKTAEVKRLFDDNFVIVHFLHVAKHFASISPLLHGLVVRHTVECAQPDAFRLFFLNPSLQNVTLDTPLFSHMPGTYDVSLRAVLDRIPNVRELSLTVSAFPDGDAWAEVFVAWVERHRPRVQLDSLTIKLPCVSDWNAVGDQLVQLTAHVPMKEFTFASFCHASLAFRVRFGVANQCLNFDFPLNGMRVNIGRP